MIDKGSRTMDIGQKILEIRKAEGLSQTEFAEKFHVTRQTVSNWENENIQPSIEMLVRLAKLFGVSTDYMLGLENTPRLNVDGIPVHVVAHLSQLVEDYRTK